MRKKFRTFEEMEAYYKTFDLNKLKKIEDFQFLVQLSHEAACYSASEGLDSSFWSDLHNKVIEHGRSIGMYVITPENAMEEVERLANSLTPPEIGEILLQALDGLWDTAPEEELHLFRQFAMQNNLDELLDAVCTELCRRNPSLN